MASRSFLKTTLFFAFLLCSSAPLSASARAKEQKPCQTKVDSAPLSESLYTDIMDLARISLLPANEATGSEEQGLYPEELQACLNTLKTNVSGRQTITLPADPALKADAKEINQVIQTGSVKNSRFSVKSINPHRVEALALEKEFKSNGLGSTDQTLVAKYRLSYASALGINRLIALNVESDLYRDGKLVERYEQTSVFDSACNQRVLSDTDTSFNFRGDQVKLTRKTRRLDGRDDNEERVISKALIDEAQRLDEVQKPSSRGEVPKHLEGHFFSSFDVSDLQYRADKVEIPRSPRLLVSNLSVRQGDLPVSTTLQVTASQANRTISKSTSFNAPGIPQYEESTSEETWKKSRMLIPYLKPKASHIDLLAPNDMRASRLELSLTMNRDENFDNWSAYARWTKAQVDPTHVRYQVEYGSEQSLPVLKSDDIARYLKETSYYDFSTPEVKALIAKVVEKHPRNAREKVLEILSVVNQALQYDREMLDRNEIYPVKASVSARVGKGVCQHYAALFVAIARAMGLPSRSVEGLAYINTTSSAQYPYVAYQATSHAWVEVSLDGQTWTPLDPQYQATLKLPQKGYIPIKEMTLYENSQAGADINLRDTRDLNDYEIDLTRVQAN